MATFTNYATLSYSGGKTDSNTVTGEILETLGVTKTAVSESYSAGEDVTYVITLTNSGTAAYTGLTVTDNLGGFSFNGTTVYPLSYKTGSIRYYINGVLQTAPTVTAGSILAHGRKTNRNARNTSVTVFLRTARKELFFKYIRSCFTKNAFIIILYLTPPDLSINIMLHSRVPRHFFSRGE